MDPSFGEFVGGALRLDRATFDLAEHSPFGLRVALTVLLLAGGSETLGQAVVLVLNRVSKRRFALALVLGGLELVFEALVWIATVWLLAGLFGCAGPPPDRFARAHGKPRLVGGLVR